MRKSGRVPYDLLDIVVVRPEAAIVYVPCQLGYVRESIVHCLGHWGFLRIYPDLGIKPSLEVLDYRIRLLLSFLLALFNAEAGNICIVFNGVQPDDGYNGGLRRRFVLHQAGDEVSSTMAPAAKHHFGGVFLKLLVKCAGIGLNRTVV